MVAQESNIKRKILTALFVLLYIAVGFVSCWHAISYFSIANEPWLATILAISFECGQAVVLFSLLTDSSQRGKTMPWVLMGTLTLVQCIGNIFASYKYMITNSQQEMQYFIDSCMWFVKDPDPQTNIVVCSYIIGAILPIIALCMTGMVVSTSKKQDAAPEEPEEIEEPEPKIFI